MPPSANRWDAIGSGPGYRTSASAWDYRWWILAAISTSIAVNGSILLVMKRYKLPAAAAVEPADLRTGVFETDIDRVSVPQEMLKDLTPETPDLKQKPANQVTRDLPDITSIAEAMKDQDFTATPVIRDTVQNLTMSTPSPGTSGDLLDAVDDVRAGIDDDISDSILSKSSTMKPSMMKADSGQLILDPLSAAGASGDLKADILKAAKKGSGGNGGLDGFTNLDDLLNVQGPITGDFKTLLRTDLLFDFGSAALREGSRLSLMKLGALIQTNGKATFRLVGHTDTIGDESANQTLSVARAQAVKDWLVNSLKLDGTRIVVEGRGEREPVPDAPANGTADEQQMNRRVEIHKTGGGK